MFKIRRETVAIPRLRDMAEGDPAMAFCQRSHYLLDSAKNSHVDGEIAYYRAPRSGSPVLQISPSQSSSKTVPSGALYWGRIAGMSPQPIGALRNPAIEQPLVTGPSLSSKGLFA
ncbi:hypothetical protein CCUS01_03646 [Colletotrichum cuscutae]|uniref:Uncharacterized protein n=1 Tax=Colletotrichum cuscutae TaxID=1209917 RepID=A0AAI9VI33_9PEZI|nr:hypothetical protein CCUS01_03646 [Colletotrichum cuscutae]